MKQSTTMLQKHSQKSEGKMIKLKEFNASDSNYKEQMEQFQKEHPNAEFIQITGGHMSPERIWFKYDDKLKEQPKLSIPKKIAEELDDKNSTLNNFNWQFFMQNHRQSFWSYSNELNEYAKDIHNYEAICAYLNPVTKLFVEVEG